MSNKNKNKPPSAPPASRKYWWSCPVCGEINASPANQHPENTVGCRCGWEGEWREAKPPNDKVSGGANDQG